MESRHMRAALEEASRALIDGDFPVGALLVHDGQVVARGRNRVTGAGDQTLHAEMDVLRLAAGHCASTPGSASFTQLWSRA